MRGRSVLGLETGFCSRWERASATTWLEKCYPCSSATDCNLRACYLTLTFRTSEGSHPHRLCRLSTKKTFCGMRKYIYIDSLSREDPHLWKEIVNTAAYKSSQMNPKRTSSGTWTSWSWRQWGPLHTGKLTGVDNVGKPQFTHLWAYGCRTCAMIEDD